MGGTGYLEGGVVDPAPDLAVSVLPHRGEQVGADWEVLGVLQTSVEQPRFGVHQPVTSAFLLVVEVEASPVMPGGIMNNLVSQCGPINS